MFTGAKLFKKTLRKELEELQGLAQNDADQKEIGKKVREIKEIMHRDMRYKKWRMKRTDKFGK